jgi:hypothetical protein
MGDTGQEIVVYESQILSKAQQAGVDLTPLLAQVPEADDDAYVGIIRQMLGAQTPADLGAAFNLQGMLDYEGVLIRVLAIKRMPSDFDSGLGLYLVCEISDVKTGEHHTVSTGSTNVIVQLVTAFVKGWLPLTCVPRLAKKPTANGYTPMHLEIVQ